VAFFLEVKMEKRKDYFDKHASKWDEHLRYDEKMLRLREIVGFFELSKGYSVLDVGTGTGVLLPFIKDAIGPEGSLFAIDFSFRMIEQARNRSGINPEILINASVEAIPFHSNRFERVTCFSAFPHFPNKTKALSEMVRVLKKGGKIFIAHLHSIEEINQLHREIGGAVGNDFLPSKEELHKLLIESGLCEISLLNEPGRFIAQGRKL